MVFRGGWLPIGVGVNSLFVGVDASDIFNIVLNFWCWVGGVGGFGGFGGFGSLGVGGLGVRRISLRECDEACPA